MKKFFQYLAGVVGLGLTGAVLAAVPVGVDTAIAAASTDAVTVGGYVIIGVAALIGIAWILGMMKKR